MSKPIDPVRTDLTRPDGRPELYDVPPAPNGSGYRCAICEDQARTRGEASGPFHQAGRIYMLNPGNAADGQPHFVCHEHTPDDAVILNPITGRCRDKKGENFWDGTKPGA